MLFLDASKPMAEGFDARTKEAIELRSSEAGLAGDVREPRAMAIISIPRAVRCAAACTVHDQIRQSCSEGRGALGRHGLLTSRPIPSIPDTASGLRFRRRQRPSRSFSAPISLER
jgi:hypothetical protein